MMSLEELRKDSLKAMKKAQKAYSYVSNCVLDDILDARGYGNLGCFSSEEELAFAEKVYDYLQGKTKEFEKKIENLESK